MEVQLCTFEMNSASGNGGGAHLQSVVSIDTVTVTGNIVSAPFPLKAWFKTDGCTQANGGGGGIYCGQSGNLTLSNILVSKNTAIGSNGGGLRGILCILESGLSVSFKGLEKIS